jgi:serine protease Do
MNDRPTDLSSRPPLTEVRRSRSSLRKFALMASVAAGLGVGAYGFSPSIGPADIFGNAAHAQVNNEVSKVQKPVGFADIVERVKPSVISVKVNINEKQTKDDSGSNSDDSTPFQPGSPMERFFRRFGSPDGMPPGLRGMPRGRGAVTGQGSGFFISADGYAVTNNHVVDGADKVEITMDDGKSYTAKVIGADARTDLALIKVEGSSNFPSPSFRTAIRASATGCLPWVIRSASVVLSPPASSRPEDAISAMGHTTILSRSTRL